MLMRAEEIQIDRLGGVLSVTLSCGFQRVTRSYMRRKLLHINCYSGFILRLRCEINGSAGLRNSNRLVTKGVSVTLSCGFQIVLRSPMRRKRLQLLHINCYSGLKLRLR